MHVTAVICVRDSGYRLAGCLAHLIANDIEYVVIDDGMDSADREMLTKAPFARWLVDYRVLPFTDVFSLQRQLELKEEIYRSLEADWVIHLDVDEIMHSNNEGESLRDAIARVDRQGFTVINFEEFVFLPVEHKSGAPVPDWQELRWYHFFRPSSPRLMRARKRGIPVSGVIDGGHLLNGTGAELCPESFALRHYIVRSQQHAFEKYTKRVFAPEEVRMGWHRDRVNMRREAFTFPECSRLQMLEHPKSRAFRRDLPRLQHYWQW